MPTNLGYAEVKRESDKAILVEIADIDTEAVWIPKSVIHDDSEVWEDEQDGDLVVKDWYAKKQGWV